MQSVVRLSNKFIRYKPVMLWKIVINTSLVAVFKLSTSKHNQHFINQKRIFNFFTVINFSWRREKRYKLDTHCALVYLSKCLFTIHVKAKTIDWIGYENTLRAVSFLFQPFMSVITKAQQKPHWRKFNSRHCDAWLKKILVLLMLNSKLWIERWWKIIESMGFTLIIEWKPSNYYLALKSRLNSFNSSNMFIHIQQKMVINI